MATVAKAAPSPGGTPRPGGSAASSLIGAAKRGASKGWNSGSGLAGKAGKAVTTTPGSVAHQASGAVLGLLVWCWVVLPYLSSGTKGVKNVLRAKFINEGPDGKPL